MPGVAKWQTRIELDIDDLKKKLQQVENSIDEVANKEYKVDLNIDTKTLDSAIQKLDKMLDSLGNGTGDFKQLENLSKELSNIVSEVQSLSKAFGKVDDSGAKTLLSSIQSIDQSLSELSKHILNVNKNMQDIGKGSENPTKQMDDIADAGKKAADAIEGVAKAQKKVSEQKTNISNGNTTPPKKNKYANAKKISSDEFINRYDEFLSKGNEIISKKGGTVLGNSVDISYDDVNELVKVSAKIKDIDGTWRSFSAKLSSDLQVFPNGFKTITKDVDKLETALENFGRGTSPSLTYQQTLDAAKKIREEANVGDDYSIKVDSNEFVTITKKLTDVENAGASVTQTFKSADDAIKNFSIAASNSAEKTSITLKGVKKASEEAIETSGISQNTSAVKENISAKEALVNENTKIKASSDDAANAFKNQSSNIKSEWDDAVSVITKYQEAQTELNRLKALDKYSGKYSEQISAQEAKIEKLKASYESAEKTVLSFFSSSNKFQQIPVSSLQEIVDVLQKIQTSSTGSIESVHRLNDALRTMSTNTLNSLKDFVGKHEVSYSNMNNRGNQTEAYKALLDNYSQKISELKTIIENFPELTILSKDDFLQLSHMKAEIVDILRQIKSMSTASKGSKQDGIAAMFTQLEKLKQKYKGVTKEQAAMISKLEAKWRSLGKSMDLSDAKAELRNLETELINANTSTTTLWNTMKEKAFYGFASQLATIFSVNDVIQGVKQGINTVKELDSAMVEVKKVSNETDAAYEEFSDTIASTAKEIASTNKELLNSSADYLRLGYNLKQASDLAKNTALFVNVGDGIDITSATEDMITAMKAFDIEAEDSMKIVDSYNQIGNTYAVSASGIGEAMKRSASALEAANNTFEESIGLITAMDELVQDDEVTGTTLKVLSLRLRGAKADLESMGESTDGLCDSTSKLREQIKALTGVDIMLDDNTFKSTTQQIKELGSVWNKLSDTSQAATLEIIAGKSRANGVKALLKNYQQIDNVIDDLADAEGSAMRENEAIVDSIEGRLEILSATAEEFWQKFINTDTVKNAITLATNFLDLLTNIIDKFGTLPTLLTAASGILGAKGLG